MNDKGYRIMNVEESTDSVFGDIIIVTAAPIFERKVGSMVMGGYGGNEDVFLFPKEETLIERVLQIARGGGNWYPDEEDFEEDTIIDGNEQRVPVYRHISFYGEDFDESLNSGQEVCLVPDIMYKAKTLNNQYYQGGWFNTYDFREYVESLAEGDDVENFWGWLFNRPDLNGLMPWDLPYDFEREYERFLDVCEEMEDK